MHVVSNGNVERSLSLVVVTNRIKHHSAATLMVVQHTWKKNSFNQPINQIRNKRPIMVDKTCGLIAGCPEMVPSVVQTYPYTVYVTLFCWIINQCLVLTRCWKVLRCQSNRTIIHVFKNKNVGHLYSTIYLITIKHILKCHILQDWALVMLDEEIRVTWVYGVTFWTNQLVDLSWQICQRLQQATLGRAGAAKLLPRNLCKVDVFFQTKTSLSNLTNDKCRFLREKVRIFPDLRDTQ